MDPAVEPDRLELSGVERRYSCQSCKRPLPVRVVVYCRVSTLDKGQDVENQLRALRQFVDNKPAEGWHLIGEYIDQASGKSANRPEFQRLFREAAKRRFDLLLFWALHRFGHEGVVETLQHLERQKASGVQW
jgi:DNA invertase Pin-like site-specific DNA recombinase